MTERLTDDAAEFALLGGIVRDANALFPRLDAMNWTPDCLSVPAHRFVYDEMYECWVQFRPVDLALLHAKLRTLTMVGNTLRRYSDELPTSTGVWLAQLYVAPLEWWPTTKQQMREWGRWIEDEAPGEPVATTLALAAARRLKYLAARRNAIFRAEELLRAAQAGDDPDLLNQEL